MPVIFARLAAAYAAAGRFSEATDAYQKAAQLSPENSGYLYNMGMSACRANRIDECRNAIRKAADLDPALGSTAYFNLGAFLVSRGLAKEAGEAFQLSIAHDPNNAETYYQVALLFVRDQATIGGAVPYLEKYLKLAPNGPNAAAARQLLDAARASVR